MTHDWSLKQGRKRKKKIKKEIKDNTPFYKDKNDFTKIRDKRLLIVHFQELSKRCTSMFVHRQ